MNITIRKSVESDRGDILKLIESSFGIRGNATEGCIADRYILAIDSDNNKAVGMTGLYSKSKYCGGYESDWTCVLPEYRKMGIGSLLIEALIKEAKSKDVVKLYWSAWRDGIGVSKVEPLLRKYGFEKVLSQRVNYMVGHNCNLNKSVCAWYMGENCRCSEDLWVLNLK